MEQRTRTRPLRKRFQSLVYFRNELYVGEGVSTLGNYFLALEKQVGEGRLSRGSRALRHPALSSFAVSDLISTL